MLSMIYVVVFYEKLLVSLRLPFLPRGDFKLLWGTYLQRELCKIAVTSRKICFLYVYVEKILIHMIFDVKNNR